MKYAVMSDIHANPGALQTALEDAREQGCDAFILLGDITGYGYDVKSALKIAREAFDVVLMGNHDSACVGLEPPLETLMIASYDQDREQRQALTADEVDWLRKCPYTHTIADAAFAHGDFTRPKAWNYILGCEDAVRNFLATDARLMFCGHTHHVAIWEQTEDALFRPKGELCFRKPARYPETRQFTPKEASRYIINVGSVGYPRKDYCITYGIWDEATDIVAIRRLPFDFIEYIASLYKNKVAFPSWLAPILRAFDKKLRALTAAEG